MKHLFLIFWLLFAIATPAFALNPDEMLSDLALEARARDISANLRCLVCQNQSIDDSDAELARDLRVLVRERLKAGDSDPAVIQYVVDRYGEFVLLKPLIAPHTIALWIAAPLALVIGLAVIFVAARRRPVPNVRVKMTKEEKAALAALGDSED